MFILLLLLGLWLPGYRLVWAAENAQLANELLCALMIEAVLRGANDCREIASLGDICPFGKALFWAHEYADVAGFAVSEIDLGSHRLPSLSNRRFIFEPI
jgi:hypothetical protein